MTRLLPKSKAARRTLLLVLVVVGAVAAAAALVLQALEQNISFYRTPSAMLQEQASDQRFRIGGLVQPNSVTYESDGVTVRFLITDNQASFPVLYKGLLPDLFKDGQGVVAEGQWRADRVFVASTLLARHDENYMPPEVARALGVPEGAAYGTQYQNNNQEHATPAGKPE